MIQVRIAVFALALLAAALPSLHAESANQDMLSTFLAPSVEARYGYDFPMPLEGSEGSFQMHEYRLSVPLVPLQSSEIVVLAALSYRLYDADLTSPSLSGHYSLNSVRMPIEAIWCAKNSPWIGVVYFEPGLSTDFRAINDHSLDLSFGAGVGYRFSKELILALGVAYSRNYGEDNVFPAFALLWLPSEHFALSCSPDGFVPEWRVNEGLHIRLKVVFLGGRWSVEDEAGRSREVLLKGGTASLEVEKRLFKKCWMSASVGTNFLASLRVRDFNGATQFEQDLKPALIVSAGLKWQF